MKSLDDVNETGCKGKLFPKPSTVCAQGLLCRSCTQHGLHPILCNLPFCEVEKTAFDRGRTDRISLTHDRELQSPVSYGMQTIYLQATCMQKFKVNSQSVPKIELKQTDRRTDGQREGDDCVTSNTNAVSTKRRSDVLMSDVLKVLRDWLRRIALGRLFQHSSILVCRQRTGATTDCGARRC